MKNIFRVMLPFLTFCILLGFVLNFSQSAKCDLESLLLQDNKMPQKWERLWKVLPPALPRDGAQDALEVVYENQNDMASHTIYRYKNGLLAFLFLRVNNEVFFPSGLRVWSELEGSDDWPLNGDEEKIRCAESTDPLLGFKCDAVIRYGQYISEFSAPIEAGIMSHEEFKAIVLAIDDRITSCFQQSKNHR